MGLGQLCIIFISIRLVKISSYSKYTFMYNNYPVMAIRYIGNFVYLPTIFPPSDLKAGFFFRTPFTCQKF